MRSFLPEKTPVSNLACMKTFRLIGRSRDIETELLLDYSQAGEYSRLYVSKVFTDTFVPEHILTRETTVYGGTGFFTMKAPVTPEAIEHHTPDYDLYDQMVKEHRRRRKKKKKEFQFYTDYSIGSLTRGCFRKCSFCVNKNSTGAVAASPLEEFYDPFRKKLCFLDDNFFACAEWKKSFPVSWKQAGGFRSGRAGSADYAEKADGVWHTGKLDNGMIFAFDHIKDQELIVRKLELLREVIHFYRKFSCMYCAAMTGKEPWKADFWAKDIRGHFHRIEILMRYKCLAYLMRYAAWERAPEIYKGMYINLSRWCNQPAQYQKRACGNFVSGRGSIVPPSVT